MDKQVCNFENLIGSLRAHVELNQGLTNPLFILLRCNKRANCFYIGVIFEEEKYMLVILNSSDLDTHREILSELILLISEYNIIVIGHKASDYLQNMK